MQFEDEKITVNLDRSYLTSPKTAFSHSKQLVQKGQVKSKWITPLGHDKSVHPCIPNAFDFMCCPRSMQNGSAKVRLGHIGSKVRRILSVAPFPVLISSPVYKPWRRIAVFYEGSEATADLLHLGLQIGEISRFPIDIFSPSKTDANKCLSRIMPENSETPRYTCQPYDTKHFIESLYAVSYEALVIVKCSTDRLIRAHASAMEKIQSTIPNNLLIVGPKYRPRFRLSEALERFDRKPGKQNVTATVH
jgi:hypothetical protein